MHHSHLRLLPACLTLALALLCAIPAQAAQQSGRRVALVIGNGVYPTAPLKNPVNDARDMAAALRAQGFEVIARENASLAQMEGAVNEFWTRLKLGGAGLFYFAGHGLQVNGRNYLVPVDARLAVEQDAKYKCMDAGMVLGRMENAGNELNIVILDACRNNPFARSWRSADAGLAKMDAPRGSIIAYATAPDSVAADGDGRNGLYTEKLLRSMRTPGLPVEQMFKRVRDEVMRATKDKQVPWESTSLRGDFFFQQGPAPAAAMPQAPAAAPSPPPAALQVAMAPAPKAPPPPPKPEPDHKPGEIWREPTTGMEFVWVPGGCFKMGSPVFEDGRGKDEGPQREVCVSGFWLGKYTVTNAEFRKLKSAHNSGEMTRYTLFLGTETLNKDRQPAVLVSWEHAQAYAQWLTSKGGGTFRLPTEAEWEYAARAGTTATNYWGERPADACAYENVVDRTYKSSNYTMTISSYHDCTDGYDVAAEVGKFKPNAFGLYDMMGNVEQWCEDVYHPRAYETLPRDNPVLSAGGEKRVYRGGSWGNTPVGVRAARRNNAEPDYKNSALGFRLVRIP
jgi:formylglycine-generating enzyme required for sulfatase activity